MNKLSKMNILIKKKKSKGLEVECITENYIPSKCRVAKVRHNRHLPHNSWTEGSENIADEGVERL